jgi:vacuolar-type H+-ATPase subunit I/STV1
LAITEFGEREFKTKEGNIYPTYELPIKTLIWFIAKFDHNLRHDVVMYAFKKLEEDQKKLIDQTTELISQTKQLEKVKQKLLSENKDLKASRFNEYEGYRSVTKLSHELDLTIGVSEMLDHLEAIGEIETFTETVQRRRRTEDALYGDEDSKLNPRYTLSEGRQMFKDYLKIK